MFKEKGGSDVHHNYTDISRGKTEAAIQYLSTYMKEGIMVL